jgi:hypothetical protein
MALDSLCGGGVCGGGVCPLVWWGCFSVAWWGWSLKLNGLWNFPLFKRAPHYLLIRLRDAVVVGAAKAPNTKITSILFCFYGHMGRAVVYTTAKTPNKKLARILCCFFGETARS